MRKIEAVQKMIAEEFNAIPLTLIEKAYPEIDGWYRITPFKPGDIVYSQFDDTEYEVLRVENGDNIRVSDEHGEEYEADIYDFYIECEPIFPMWATVWHAEGLQSEWIGRNLDKVAACGFEIYEADDLDGYIIGVNGAGYNFYEAHWIPLYEAQDLKWHNEV